MRASLTVFACSVALAPLGLASCPAPQEPVDARVFIESVFAASLQCFPSFLGEAEPVFVDVKAQAEIDAAVAKFERDTANPRVEFSRAAYDSCLEVARNNDCDAIADDSGPCASVFRGLLNNGDVCAENVECASGLSCFQERDACGTCTPLAVVGESCATSNCVDGAQCDGQQICRTQENPTAFVEGQACQLQPGCGGVSTGLVCVDNLCQPMEVVDEGEACEIGIGVTRYCRNSSTTHLCDGGICTARPGLGAPCSAVGACNSTEAACVDGTCVDDGGLPGDACTNGFGCQIESTCERQVCTALVDVPLPPVCE